MRRTGQRRHQRLGPVEAVCLNCPWTASGGSWRPVKRRLEQHRAKVHRDLVAEVAA